MTDTESSKKGIYQALRELLNANSPLYQNEIENLRPARVNLLKAVAHGEKQLTSTRACRPTALELREMFPKTGQSLLTTT